MKKVDIKALASVLHNPIRREIVIFLINPQANPKTFSGIKNWVSEKIDKAISDGSLGWHLKDLRAEKIIDKDDEKKTYWLTKFGDKIAKKVNIIVEDIQSEK